MIRFARSRRVARSNGGAHGLIKTALATGVLVVAFTLVSACSDAPTGVLTPGTGSGQYRALVLMPMVGSMTVTASGTALGTGLAFGEASSYVTLDAGSYHLNFQDATADTSVGTINTGVEDGMTYTACVMGAPGFRTFLATRDLNDGITAGMARVEFWHAAVNLSELSFYDAVADTLLEGGITFGNATDVVEVGTGVTMIGVDTDKSSGSYEATITIPAMTSGTFVRIYATAVALADTMSITPVLDGAFRLVVADPSGATVITP